MLAARTAAVILALTLMAAVGCSSVKEAYHEFDPRPRPADVAFAEVLKKYMVKGSIHRGPATELLTEVVPANWAVRTAWVERRAEAFAYTPEQKAKELADQRLEYEQHNTVLASVFVPENKWNDLGEQGANWKVYLINAKGQRVEPMDVRRIKKRTAINEAIYPFWGLWSRLYLFKFPIKDAQGNPFLAPGEKEVTLLITGAPGKKQLKLVIR
ncbi:MAG: hypothetical protein KJ720_02325 [Proteobacteria bacterium]|nr:hypothetical protein [Pseudomonadota bacterium]MBU1449350.1 hypothetical protein [Pseudomonadota bacterium]MBU2470277.1 hypothetical protein [Pseudomonadota bacterium]MBU2519351.1 hypothetical protein [Pseudomonadota bacterium]